jgi:lipopolysaccharide assembly outer membrane protein LptD (OstA)
MDGRTGEFVSHDLGLQLQDPRGDSLGLAYDFESPKSKSARFLSASERREYEQYEEIRTDLGLVLNSEWRTDFSTRFDMQADRPLETYARLMYVAQCYALGVFYADNENDRRIGLVVDLLGFSSLNYDRPGLAAVPSSSSR